LSGYGAFTNPSFARKDQDFVFDVFELLVDEFDSGVDLKFA
jgi:hypothetical protein